MTLSFLEGYSSVTGLFFKCDFYGVCGMSHGPSASADLFVIDEHESTSFSLGSLFPHILE